MYKKIKSFFTQNLHWKAFSILMAAVLWFIVMNINNPTEVKTFSLEISPLNLEDLEKNNLTILNIDEINEKKIEIKVKATRPVLDELTKKMLKNEIKAYIDLTNIASFEISNEPKNFIAQIKTTLSSIPYPNNNFEILSFTPTSMNLNIDSVITIPKKININKKGTPKSGYISMPPELSSEYIKVTGAKSIVDTIENVSVEVDISNQSSRLIKKIPPVAYDKSGNIIENILFNVPEITINMPIILQDKLAINKPQIQGNLPDGYIIKNITYEPSYIEVIGDTQYLKNLNYIKIPAIDVTNLTKSTEYTFNLNNILQSYNISMKNPNKNILKVNIEVEKISSKNISVPTSQLNIIGYNDEFNISLDETFDLELSGSKDILDKIVVSDINASINLKGLGLGNHKIKIDVNLPENILILNNPEINLSISEKEIVENPIEISSEPETTSAISTETTT